MIGQRSRIANYMTKDLRGWAASDAQWETRRICEEILRDGPNTRHYTFMRLNECLPKKRMIKNGKVAMMY